MGSTSRRRFLGLAIAQASLASIVGCGTILHPERRGQPAGPLDWKIVAFDAIGLLLFFLPGVIAFAVDFSNGTIYLPPDQVGLKGPPQDTPQQPLVAVSTSGEPMTPQKLEEIISRHTQREIHLQPGAYQTRELKTIDEFWTVAHQFRGQQKPA